MNTTIRNDAPDLLPEHSSPKSLRRKTRSDGKENSNWSISRDESTKINESPPPVDEAEAMQVDPVNESQPNSDEEQKLAKRCEELRELEKQKIRERAKRDKERHEQIMAKLDERDAELKSKLDEALNKRQAEKDEFKRKRAEIEERKKKVWHLRASFYSDTQIAGALK